MASTSSAPEPAFDDHLFYPDVNSSSEVQPQAERPLLKDRLYVGNLHPSVDDTSVPIPHPSHTVHQRKPLDRNKWVREGSTLLQVFAKFGKVTKLDWLYHKTGALKGKPRGYAFVEYATADDAANALATANDKLLRGRRLVVTFAHEAPLSQHTSVGARRRTLAEAGRPTALSMLKTGVVGRNGHEGKTTDKIAILEAKLRQMARESPAPGALPTSTSRQSSSPSAIESVMGALSDAVGHVPAHPSLPAKPPPQVPGAPPPIATPTMPPARPPATLSKLGSGVGALAVGLGGLGVGLGGAPKPKPRLAGVRIKKSAPKDAKPAAGEKEGTKGA